MNDTTGISKTVLETLHELANAILEQQRGDPIEGPSETLVGVALKALKMRSDETVPPTSNPLAQICSCTWVKRVREPGIHCRVHPRPMPSKDEFRRATRQIDLLPCRLCGTRAELWQRWVRDDVWESFGACTNPEDVDGEECQFHLPDSPHFYHERRTDAAQYWNLIMGPRSSDETTAHPPCVCCGGPREKHPDGWIDGHTYSPAHSSPVEPTGDKQDAT